MGGQSALSESDPAFERMRCRGTQSSQAFISAMNAALRSRSATDQKDGRG